MTPAPGSDYLTTEVMTATPQKLQLMLIEAAIRLAQQAKGHWTSDQDEAATAALLRGQQIMAQLLAGMNVNPSDDLVERVAGVYAFVYRALVKANLERDEASLSDALRVLEVERETWRLVCQQLGSYNDRDVAVGSMSFEA